MAYEKALTLKDPYNSIANHMQQQLLPEASSVKPEAPVPAPNDMDQRLILISQCMADGLDALAASTASQHHTTNEHFLKLGQDIAT